MANGCDASSSGIWGRSVLDEFVDIPLVSVDPTMGTLRDLVGGDYDGEDDDDNHGGETADVDDLRTRATRPWGEMLD